MCYRHVVFSSLLYANLYVLQRHMHVINRLGLPFFLEHKQIHNLQRKISISVSDFPFEKNIVELEFQDFLNGRHSFLIKDSKQFSYSIPTLQCHRCLSPLMLCVRILLRARCTTLCDTVCQWLTAGRWFSLGTPTKQIKPI